MKLNIFKNILCIFISFLLITAIIPFNCIRSSASVQIGGLIEYGSYPQTKVTDQALITALDAITPDGNDNVTYGGEKYKSLLFTQYKPYWPGGNPSNPENTCQDDNGYYINTRYWFKHEPIQWRVLADTDGELILVSERILNSREYNSSEASTWETCTLRTWLNNTFYNSAFTNEEKAGISNSSLTNDNNPWHGTDGGNSTNDKVFILSYSDVMNTTYNFSSSATTSDPNRIAQGTDYARSDGLLVTTTGTYTGNSYWWLRSPGSSPYFAGAVLEQGYVYTQGSRAFNAYLGVRPAIIINMYFASFNIKFDPNGVSGTATPQSIGYNQTADLFANIFTRTGYSFVGWATSPSGPVIYMDCDTYKMDKAGTTLYAVWSKIPESIIAKVGSTAIINSTFRFIYGLRTGLLKKEFEEDFVQITGDARLEYSSNLLNLGTGSKIYLTDNETNETIEMYTIIIFGDVNNDGNIDSIDAGGMVDHENYLLLKDPINDADFYRAGDINDDGNIDSIDAGITVDIENYMIEIDQSTGLVR